MEIHIGDRIADITLVTLPWWVRKGIRYNLPLTESPTKWTL